MSSQLKSQAKFEVAVVGGGMVGATLASALARCGLRIALIEGREPERIWAADSLALRVSAITPASRRIYEALGAWPDIAARGVSPFRKMRVRDPRFGGELQFAAADVGQDSLGYIIENRVIVAALWDQLESVGNVAILCPARVLDLQRGSEGAVLRLEDGGAVSAELVVGADGAESGIRSLSGIRASGWSYGQEAIVANVETGRWHGETAYQHFLPEGPLAFLPLKDGRSSIVWTSSIAAARQHLEMEDEAFCMALEKASGGISGAIQGVGERAAFRLRLHRANCYVAERVALVGDAVHCIHPLAGQGANLGLLDAAALAEVIASARQRGRPIGALHTLRRYERWRKGDNLVMMAAVDGLKRLYGLRSGPAGYLRSFGMNCLNNVTPLKGLFIGQATGLRRDLPRLAAGVGCWHSSS